MRICFFCLLFVRLLYHVPPMYTVQYSLEYVVYEYAIVAPLFPSA